MSQEYIQLFTVDGRKKIAGILRARPNLNLNLLVCERGFLDNDEGVAVSDDFVLGQLLRPFPVPETQRILDSMASAIT